MLTDISHSEMEPPVQNTYTYDTLGQKKTHVPRNPIDSDPSQELECDTIKRHTHKIFPFVISRILDIFQYNKSIYLNLFYFFNGV